jgi:hypothetical protein
MSDAVPPIDESLAPNTTHLEALGQRVEDLDALGEQLRIGEHPGILQGDLRQEVPQVLGRMLHYLADALHHVHAINGGADRPAPTPPPVVETDAARADRLEAELAKFRAPKPSGAAEAPMPGTSPAGV